MSSHVEDAGEAAARRPSSGAFDGVTVLELGQIYNGPYAGFLMAQLGADVIKIEPPTGDRLRHRTLTGALAMEFLMLNSNKRSVCIDLKSAAGRDVFLALVDDADVVIENFGPDTMDRLGLPPAALLERNPRLIYASGKGYGDGPYRSLTAMDITIQAMSGTIASTGLPDGPPVKAGPAFADFMAGTHLFAGIASALVQRANTGRGQHVEVAMLDAVYVALASAYGTIYNHPELDAPERTGNRHSGLSLAPYNVYRAADGHIAVISVSERAFAGLTAAMGQPEMATDERFATPPARVLNMDELDARIEAWTSTLPRWELTRILQEASVPCAPVQTVSEAAEDRHLVERGMVRFVDHPDGGSVPVPASPIRLADSPQHDLTSAPSLGADTAAVLRERLGYDDVALAALREDGAIR